MFFSSMPCFIDPVHDFLFFFVVGVSVYYLSLLPNGLQMGYGSGAGFEFYGLDDKLSMASMLGHSVGEFSYCSWVFFFL